MIKTKVESESRRKTAAAALLRSVAGTYLSFSLEFSHFVLVLDGWYNLVYDWLCFFSLLHLILQIQFICVYYDSQFHFPKPPPPKKIFFFFRPQNFFITLFSFLPSPIKTIKEKKNRRPMKIIRSISQSIVLAKSCNNIFQATPPWITKFSLVVNFVIIFVSQVFPWNEINSCPSHRYCNLIGFWVFWIIQSSASLIDLAAKSLYSLIYTNLSARRTPAVCLDLMSSLADSSIWLFVWLLQHLIWPTS